MNHPSNAPLRSLAFVTALCVTTLTLAGQPQPTPTPPPQQPEPKPTPKPTSEPSLDELLGLPANTPPKPAEPQPTPTPTPTPDDAIKRALQDADKPAGFEDIVELMSTAGDRLTARSDAGLDTQRTQEDALRKLDKLISEAKKQQQKKKQKSKSKSKPEDSPSEQQQQQQQQSSQAEQRASSSSQESSTGGGPGRQDGPLKTPLAGGEASWGNLPPHVRDALRQGSSDRFSSLYRTLTEEYYKRLAEQPRPTSTRPNPEDETP